MSERTVIVLTEYPDIASLAEALVERVDENRLMLYAADPVDENQWVGFEVLLGDRTVAFSGRGLAVGSFDGGEDRPEEARFDIVLESLELSGASDAVYDRILMLRNGDGAGTGEVDLAEVEAHEAAAAAAGDMDRNFDEEPTRLGPVDLDVDVSVDLASHGLQPPDEEHEEPATAIADLAQSAAAYDSETSEHALPEGEPDYADAAASWDAPVAQGSSPGSVRPPSVRPASVRPAASDDWGGLSPASDVPPAEAPVDTEDHPVPATDDEWADAAADAGDWAAQEASPAPSRPPSVAPAAAAPARRSRSSLPPRPKAAWEQDFASLVAQAGEEPPGAPVPGEPSAPAPFAVGTIAESGVILSRPSSSHAWDPSTVMAHRDPKSSTGDFAYAAGDLPVPAAPPRAASSPHMGHSGMGGGTLRPQHQNGTHGGDVSYGEVEERDFVEGEDEAF